MPFNKKKRIPVPQSGIIQKMKTPHTYAIIFAAYIPVLAADIFRFRRGNSGTHKVEYTDSNGAVKTKTVLMADTFRYCTVWAGKR